MHILIRSELQLTLAVVVVADLGIIKVRDAPSVRHLLLSFVFCRCWCFYGYFGREPGSKGYSDILYALLWTVVQCNSD